MSTITACHEALVHAPADRVYRYVADFTRHHPSFLPPAFSEVQVEQGGVGAGTVVRFNLSVGGTTKAYRSEIREPEPGRVLVEADPVSRSATTWTVLPEGCNSRVRIHTSWEGASGARGLIERLVAPRLLRGLYADELARLDCYASAQEED